MRLKPEKNQMTWGITIFLVAVSLMFAYSIIFNNKGMINGLGKIANSLSGIIFELRFAGGRRDMSDETAAKCIYVGMSAGIAGPLLTTPGADFNDDRDLALRAGYAVGGKTFPS